MKLNIKENNNKSKINEEARINIKEGAKKCLGSFLILMLLFTLLSRVADSLTIPKVIVTQPKNGVIEHKIEIEGRLKPKDEITEYISAGLKVKEVYIEVGTPIKTGDLLVELDGTEILGRLEQARTELRKLELQKLQLSLDKTEQGRVDIVEEVVLKQAEVETDNLQITQKERLKVEQAKQDKLQAEKELEEATEEFKELEKKTLEQQIQVVKEAIELAKKELETQLYEKDKALKRAEKILKDEKEKLWLVAGQGTDATLAFQNLEQAKMEYDLTTSDYNRRVKEAEENLKKTKSKLVELEKGEIDLSLLTSKKEKVEIATKQVKAAERALEMAEINEKLVLEGLEKEEAKILRQLDKAKEEQIEYDEEQKKLIQQGVIRKEILALDILQKQKEVEQLERIYLEAGKIYAQEDGIITEVNMNKGELTTGDADIRWVQEESTYVFEGEVDTERVQGLNIGDKVQVTLKGRNEVLKEIKIEQIYNLTGDKQDKKKIIAYIPHGEPEVNAIMKTTIISNQYDCIIPLEAIRQDISGIYILIIKEENTVLGQQYIVERRDVKEIEKNYYKMAIDAILGADDQIIIGSNKRIGEGDRIRLMEQ